MSTTPKHRDPRGDSIQAVIGNVVNLPSLAECSDPGECGAAYCPKHWPADYAHNYADHRPNVREDRSILMDVYRYMVTVEAPSPEQADQVMAERITHDEDLGFDYTLDWGPMP